MGNGPVTAAATVLILVSTISLGDGIRCYVCGPHDPRCEDPSAKITGYEPLSTVDCNSVRSLNYFISVGIYALAKTTNSSLSEKNLPRNAVKHMACYKAEVVILGVEVTHRGCFNKGDALGVFIVDKIKEFNLPLFNTNVKHGSTCDEDGCNHSALYQPTTMLVLLAAGYCLKGIF